MTPLSRAASHHLAAAEEEMVEGDAIEREIFIEAGIERVWSLVSKTGFWVGDGLRFDVDAKEGETVALDAGAYGRFPVRVERLDPPRYAAYRWASAFPGAAPTAANSTLVEITLVEREGGVLLRLRESGFAGLAGTRGFRTARRDDNVAGWAAQLGSLRRVAEGVPAR
jgi:uncharacterized protein YndB with AHSA1/START domain